MLALVDSDLIVHPVAASCENETLDIAISRCDSLMNRILTETQATEYKAFLTGSNNFRYAIDPLYKANRTGKPRPRWLQECREFMVTEWAAKVTDGYEADDALGIWSTIMFLDSIICSFDKDLRQLAGVHYDWRIDKNTEQPKGFLEVNELDGLRNFYISSLVGDSSDNIHGVAGLGPVKSKRLLAECENEQDMFNICRECYNDDERYIRNLQLLWILRDEGEVYCPVRRGVLAESDLSSLVLSEEASAVGQPNILPLRTVTRVLR